MKPLHCKRRRETGQAIVLVLLVISIFLLGGVGLAIDGSHMFAQRQIAQAAADAAAQAAILSIFDGTYSSGTHQFPVNAGFTCNSSDQKTPCYYAQTLNGFNTALDTVTIDYPSAGSVNVPAGSLSTDPSDPVNLVRATVQRTVNTTLIRLLGPTSATVRAEAVAAILQVDAPVPIVVLHPNLDGAFDKQGTNDIVICGGPSKSIQVNSRHATALRSGGTSGQVNLSHAGPLDTLGDCSLGTGTDFGSSGGQTSFPGTLLLGARPGKYAQPASPLKDPLAGVSAPSLPPVAAPFQVSTSLEDWGCPGGGITCRLYHPGRYDSGITVSGNIFALFEPGIYYITSGGFNLNSQSAAAMVPSTCGSCPAPPAEFATKRGMLIFNSGDTKDDIISFTANAGEYGSRGINLVGADEASIYKGILFFQDRTSVKHHQAPGGYKPHSIQGGADISLKGTIYLTNTATTMNSDPDHYQTLSLQGNSGSTTKITGQIIVDAIELGGSSTITMNLNSSLTFKVRQVALVK